MWSRRLVWRCWLWVTLVPGLVQADDLLRGTVESLPETEPTTLEGVPLWSGGVLARFYWSRDYRLAWQRQTDLDALLAAIEASPADGLLPADFHVATVRRLGRAGVLDGLGRAERLAADIQLSDALLRYIHHIRFGRLDPAQVNGDWNHRPAVSADTLVQAMSSVLDAPDPQARLAEQAPQPFFYRNLKRALSEYGADSRLRALPPVPAGRALARGDRDPRVVPIRDRLNALGDHSEPPPADPSLFDEALRASVMAFQRRVGLSADGVAGPTTVAALNRPSDAKQAEQIRVNLERMRWFYDELPQDYVLVDVAGFVVHVVRGGKVGWSTRVVVGTREQQTPSFRDEMEHVIFNPTWTVPPSIQKTMRGPGRFKMVDRRTGRPVSGGNASDYRRYSLIQPAGPTNALGQVKFIFPNGQAVYLHDTPSKSLFSQTVRAYSHGCVRVQNPLKLAEVILNRPSWDRSAIDRAVASNRTRYVHLEEHLPVILYYLTAMADEDGKVSFRNDIYGRDADVRRAFAEEASKARVSFGKPQPILVDPPAPLPKATVPAGAATPAGRASDPPPPRIEADAPHSGGQPAAALGQGGPVRRTASQSPSAAGDPSPMERETVSRL